MAKITIDDIAKKVNVSNSTVSRILMEEVSKQVQEKRFKKCIKTGT